MKSVERLVVLTICGSVLTFPTSNAFAGSNTAPSGVIIVPSDTTPDEGSEVSVSGSWTDPDADTWEVIIDWGDGTADTVVSGLSSQLFGPVTHTYVDGAAAGTLHTITVTVDDGLETANNTQDVTAQNVAPTADFFTSPSEFDEGTLPQNVLITDGSSDPGMLDFDGTPPGLPNWTWDFGDGNSSNLQNPFHSYSVSANDAVYEITLTVRDDDGATDSITKSITVLNVPPTADIGGPYVVNFGASIQLDASGSTDPFDPLTYAWDLDGDGDFDDSTDEMPTFDATSLSAGKYPIAVAVFDDDTSSIVTGNVIVDNTVAPTPLLPAVTTPRSTDFGVYVFAFTEGVENVDVSDFFLTRDSNAIDLLGQPVTEVTPSVYQIDLSTFTGSDGDYVFGLSGSNDIQDFVGTSLTSAPSISVTVDGTPSTSTAFIADNTQVGGDITGGTYLSGDGDGVGVAEVRLWGKEPGVPWSDLGSLTGGAFSFTPTQGPGIYEFSTTAVDLLGNAEVAPSGSDAGDVAVFYNDVENGAFEYSLISEGEFVFPMTNELDVALTFSGGATGGPISVARTVGDVAESGFDATRLIDEALSITGSFTGSVVITWNFDPASDDALTGSLDTVYQFNGGSLTETYTVSPSGSTLTISGVTSFSDWYAGSGFASANEWMLLND